MSDEPAVLWLHERSLREEGCALSVRAIPLAAWLQLVRDEQLEVTPYPGAPPRLDSTVGPVVALRVEKATPPESWVFGVPVTALDALADVMTPDDYAAVRSMAGLAPHELHLLEDNESN